MNKYNNGKQIFNYNTTAPTDCDQIHVKAKK